MSSILFRIKQISDNEKVNITSLETKIGASKGVLSRALKNNTDIVSKWITKIVENFPQYNTRWLLTGEGSMLNENSSLTINGDNNGVNNTGNISGSIFTNTGNIRIENPTAEMLYKQEILRLKNEIKLKEREALILERDVLSYKEIMAQMKESQELIKGLYERKIEDLKRTINILETRMESSNESRQNN